MQVSSGAVQGNCVQVVEGVLTDLLYMNIVLDSAAINDPVFQHCICVTGF